MISSTAGMSHRSCPPLCFTACETSMAALPAPNSVGSMMALNGPLRGRFPIRNSLSLSAREILAADGFVARDTTAGTADRCEIILADVNCTFEYRGSDFRTEVRISDRSQDEGAVHANALWLSPLVSTTNSWSFVCFCNIELCVGVSVIR